MCANIVDIPEVNGAKFSAGENFGPWKFSSSPEKLCSKHYVFTTPSEVKFSVMPSGAEPK